MAIEYWIQLENRPWDLSPHNIDRMTGQNMQAVTGQPPAMATLTSVVPGTPPRMVNMFNPLRDGANVIDALILRRYRPPAKPDGSDAWTVPDDRKVNPWDLNEHNPGETGTMGTIPGPVIECQLGDTVHVHFRNADGRAGKDVLTRTHSLHPHGFVFQTTSDGAYPLTPPDPAQPVGAEAAAWAGVGVSGQFKQGDRVPPGGTFTYTWETFGWPSTAGVWLYHDHSICDMENIELGAIGIIVIHNNAGDPSNEVDIRLDPNSPVDPSAPDPALVPGGSADGSPTTLRCFPFPEPPLVLPGLLGQLGLPADHLHTADTGPQHDDDDHDDKDAPASALSLRVGSAVLELSHNLTELRRFCLPVYRTPPGKMLILQLYHSLKNAGMCINGRKYLGNTPTIVSGRDTRMRFGVVGMGSDTHTFHLHGHRWTIPGPDGNDPVTIQGSPQNHPVSQFEDTRIFGPANSLAFTIDGKSGSFMRAGGPAPDAALGEWHMHCHVLNHMMTGMMGSLLIIRGGELAFGLPAGVPCPPDTGGTPPAGTAVHLTTGAQFSPQAIMINAGDTVTWKWDDGADHSVTSDTGLWDSGVKSGGPPFPQFSRTFTTPGTFPYHCVIHGGPGGVGMSGTVTVM
jgi:FtsP/CotA-like multicopper oxidase with cupredoxin domain/plastocyanin